MMGNRKNFLGKIFGRGRLGRGILMGALVMGVLTGCKTTVSNYQAAYDVAREKARRDSALQAERRGEMGLAATGALEEVEGWKRMLFDGEHVWVKSVRPSDRALGDSLKGEYGVSVACFRMETNAGALAGDLRAEGYEGAMALRCGDDCYVIAGHYAKAGDALELLGRYAKRTETAPGQPAPGLLMLR